MKRAMARGAAAGLFGLAAVAHDGVRAQAPAPVEEVRVGGIAVRYRSDIWAPLASDPAGGPVILACLPPTCRDPGPLVFAGAREGACPAAAGDDWSPDIGGPQDIVAGGPGGTLHFRLDILWRGCRNGTAPRLLACAVHEGVAYSIAAPGAAGCGSGPGVPREAFVELVEGVRVLP